VLGIARSNAHLAVMTKSNRPKPPAYLSKSPPVPKPEETGDATPPAGEEHRLNPTRYGDWEKKGIAVDF
jgi:hypothetical protein